MAWINTKWFKRWLFTEDIIKLRAEKQENPVKRIKANRGDSVILTHSSTVNKAK